MTKATPSEPRSGKPRFKKPSERPESGRRLREFRIAAALSGAELALRAGIDAQHVYKMENHTGISTLPVAYRLATALGISLEGLLGQYTGFDEYPPQVAERIEQGVPPIRALRSYHARSAKQLADQCGVSVQYMTRLESGKALCRPELLLKLAAVMQVSADRLGRDMLVRGRSAHRLPERLPIPIPVKKRNAAREQAEAFATGLRSHIDEILHHKPASCREVADRLNQLGLSTRQGRPWKPKDAWKVIRILGLPLPRRRFLIGKGDDSLGEGPETAPASGEDGFGRRLRHLRARRGISIKELAAKTGISASSISLIETKRGRRSIKQATRLASALGVPLEAFASRSTGAAAYPELVSQWIGNGASPLRALRWFREFSLEELSAACGISEVHLSQMERGQRLCRTEAFFELAAALRISADLLAKDVVDWCDAHSRRKPGASTQAQQRSQVQEFAELMRPHFEAALKEDPKTYAEMVEILNRSRVPTLWDGRWTVSRVQTVAKRLGPRFPWSRKRKATFSS